ncbi:hypothetical protein VCR15J2_470513 [Vibrio coralliirubri]|uniref:hypothetical protein n=1 Tax=Vibrio coralliirubri TaxID=1516159 RepID=UPI0006371738|nr:hypothetical protein [Vibrio coralliirubri]CDT67724.1 hypothetical protein VCR15J2_470513 [Vibrio coralliirubri]
MSIDKQDYSLLQDYDAEGDEILLVLMNSPDLVLGNRRLLKIIVEALYNVPCAEYLRIISVYVQLKNDAVHKLLSVDFEAPSIIMVDQSGTFFRLSGEVVA